MRHQGSVFLHQKVDQNSELPAEKNISSFPDVDINYEPDLMNGELEADLLHEPDTLDIPDISGDITLDKESNPCHSSAVIYLLEPDDNGFDTRIAENHLDEAGKIISQSGLQFSPHRGRQMEILIRAYAGNGEYDKAIGWSDRLIAVDVLNPRPYLLKAAVLDEQGLYNQSLQALRQSLYAFPDYLPAHLAIAGIYNKTGKPDLARHHYELAIQFLESKDEDTILEETEGIPARKMKDMIQMLLGG
jgi:tetratricopeptide (TPR) repeat protein